MAYGYGRRRRRRTPPPYQHQESGETRAAGAAFVLPTPGRRAIEEAELAALAGPTPTEETTADGATVLRFDSPEDYLAWSTAGRHCSEAKDRDTGAQWRGTATHADAVSLAQDGWTEGADLAKSLIARHVDTITAPTIRPEAYMDVTGVAVDVGTYLSGEPECFLAFQSVEVPSRVVSVSLNKAVAGVVELETIVARGAAMLALVDILETAGYSVEVKLLAALNTSYHGGTRSVSVMLKHPDQPADYARLAFWLAHPSAFRVIHRHGFAQTYGRWAGTTVTEVPTELCGDIHVGRAWGGEADWIDAESSRNWILGHLRTLGIEAEASR